MLGLGFRGFGFRGLGFRGLGFRGFGVVNDSRMLLQDTVIRLRGMRRVFQCFFVACYMWVYFHSYLGF